MQSTQTGKRLSVIDLGTNTFHILIAEQVDHQSFKEIFRQRIFVKLGEDGLDTIGQEPFQRGLNAILKFKNILQEYQVDQVKALGTAALRTASNGPLFVEKVKDLSGISISLINGMQEAEYIYLGVIQAVVFDHDPKLIMDIGGGSVEFIIANQDGICWAQSFPIGLSVLYNKFHHSNPIATPEVAQLHQFLDKNLLPLFYQLEKYPVHQLVGAAGTFDVLDRIKDIQEKHPHYTSIPVQKLKPIFDLVSKSTIEERANMNHIPKARIDMIVVAFLLTNYIFQKANIQELIVSGYALKEGILGEMVKNIE